MASFKQQELKAWQPVLTPVAVIAMLLVVFVVFLPIGIVLEDCSNRVIEQSVRYDNIGACDQVDASLNYNQLPKTCSITSLQLEHDFEPPIYIYYELKNLNQNQILSSEAMGIQSKLRQIVIHWNNIEVIPSY